MDADEWVDLWPRGSNRRQQKHQGSGATALLGAVEVPNDGLLPW